MVRRNTFHCKYVYRDDSSYLARRNPNLAKDPKTRVSRNFKRVIIIIVLTRHNQLIH